MRVITALVDTRRWFLAALFATAGFAFGSASAVETLQVGLAPAMHLSYPDVLEESVAQIDRDQILRRFADPDMFNPAGREIANFGFSERTWWLHSRLQTSGAAERIVVVDNPLLRHVEFYLRHADGRVETITEGAGDGAPYANLSLPAGAVSDLFVRVTSQHPLVLPLMLYTPEGYASEREMTRFNIGLILGVLAALVAYNLLLAVAMRKHSYRWMALHLFSFGVLLIAFQGIGVGALIDLSGERAENLPYAALSFAMFGMLGYTASLLGLAKQSSVAAKVIKSLALLRLVLAAVALYVPGQWLAQLCVALLLPETATIALCAIVFGIKGSKPARLLLIAWTLLLAVLCAGSLLAFAVLPSTGYASASLIIALLIGAAVITFASVQRYESLTDQVETATLTAATGLEKSVAERTRSLATTMAALNEANQRLRDANDHDGLTGVFNRRYFDRSIEPMLSRSRTAGQAFSALVADIDHFKRINDNAGHLVGDDCIRMVARVLQQNLGHAQPVIRYGGEEFVVLLPGMNVESALKIAETLRSTIAAQSIRTDKDVLRLTISIGVATVPPSYRMTAASLIKAADKALYVAKGDGRNRVVHAGSVTEPAVG